MKLDVKIAEEVAKAIKDYLDMRISKEEYEQVYGNMYSWNYIYIGQDDDGGIHIFNADERCIPDWIVDTTEYNHTDFWSLYDDYSNAIERGSLYAEEEETYEPDYDEALMDNLELWEI